MKLPAIEREARRKKRQIDKLAIRLIGLMDAVPEKFSSAQRAAKWVLRRIAAAERRVIAEECRENIKQLKGKQ